VKALIVGTALDTNGQNARYVEAAKRWGDDPDVLKALVVGKYDPADVGGRFREAAAKHGGLAIRSAHASEAYFEFPADIRWMPRRHGHPNNALVQQLADECDVIHLNNSHHAYNRLRMHRLRKPALLHHHGTLFRNHPDGLLLAARQFHMLQCVSTIDLQRRAPDLLHWLPTAYDLDALMAIRQDHRRPDDGKVRIVSCPTNREIKSTDALEAAVSQLQAEGLPVELVIVTGRPWAESLAVKATADIYFDQVGLGYGCNAVEAWGMGIPVVAGADPWTLGRMRQQWNTDTLPFMEATEDSIRLMLKALVVSKDARDHYAGLGMAHVQKYHAEKPALARLAELYAMAIAKKHKAIAEGATWETDLPGVFRSEKPDLRVTIASRHVQFVDGIARVDDPEIARRIRNIAARTSNGITEVVEDVA
jgi:sugar/nucleoside kinase (ribokinase family)